MVSKIFSAFTFLCIAAAVTAMPTMKTVSRQEGFVFATETLGPAAAEATTESGGDTTAVTASPAPVPDTPADMTTDEVEVAAETPGAETEPVPVAMPAAVPATMPAGSMEGEYTFAYNIGGTAVGDFQADPVDMAIGETSVFEIADAVIEGAPEEYADVYKSHRYGLVGSTWGYDIAVETPGVYNCSLHYSEIFSEFFTEEPNRTFMVQVSGDGAEEVQEAEFDVMVELQGAEFTPYIRVFEDISIASTLTIRETPSIGDAFLAGITCRLQGPLA